VPQFISINDKIELSPTYASIPVEYTVSRGFQDYISISGTELTPLNIGSSILNIINSATHQLLSTMILVCETADLNATRNPPKRSFATVARNANVGILGSNYIGGDQFQVTWSNLNMLTKLIDPLTGISYTPNKVSIYNATSSSTNTTYSGSSGTGVVGVSGPGSYTLEIAAAYYDPTGGPGGTPLLLTGSTQQTDIAVVAGSNPLSGGTSQQSSTDPRDYSLGFTSTDSSSRTYSVQLVSPGTTTLVKDLGSYVSTNGVTNQTVPVTIPSDVPNGTYDIIITDAVTGEVIRVAANVAVSGFGDVTAPVINNLLASWDDITELLTVSYDSLVDNESGIYSALLTVATGANFLANELDVLSHPIESFAVAKNGNTYNITLKVTNNAGLQTIGTTNVIIPAGFGTAGFGRDGFGR
jgi:hypothetical protein